MVYLGPYIPEDFEIEAMFAQLSIAKSVIPYGATNVQVGDALPSDSIIVGIAVRVDTPWNVPGQMTLGDNVDPDLYAGPDGVDLNTAGLYLLDPYGETLGPSSVNAYINAPGASAGEASVFLLLRFGAA